MVDQVSHTLRALYNDMSRCVCCAGNLPSSGRCGGSQCPELCLCTESQRKIEMDKRDGKSGPQPAIQDDLVEMQSHASEN
ncbi:hypothetical protein D5086_004994 [Populus alba]|uniref:Uncharacterized protein n=1 Tax=Populus alba TaxID=43335 RepID=A0ACC4CS21_POPAL